jgi:hypothetical protein
MTRRRPLGLDELLIVNPGPRRAGAIDRAQAVVLRQDGAVYQLQGCGPAIPGECCVTCGHTCSGPMGLTGARGQRPYFLGADGAIYELMSWEGG